MDNGPFCPFPSGGYCDLKECEGPGCEFFPGHDKGEADDGNQHN